MVVEEKDKRVVEGIPNTGIGETVCLLLLLLNANADMCVPVAAIAIAIALSSPSLLFHSIHYPFKCVLSFKYF